MCVRVLGWELLNLNSGDDDHTRTRTFTLILFS